jgi:hypothetical protein
MNIPLNIPICLKAHTGNNLQNEFFWRNARCKNDGTGAWEQMILIQTDDNKVVIQSRWNDRCLQVQPDGACVFANHNMDWWEKFDVECDEHGKVYFISCHTGKVMQCNDNGHVCCANENRLGWEAWTLISPETSEMLTSSQLRHGLLGATGAILVPVIGLTMQAAVPTAMSTYGCVRAGVGTFHAPLNSFGCASVLQASSSALLTPTAVVVGGTAGVLVAQLFDKKQEEGKLCATSLHDIQEVYTCSKKS